MTRDEKIQDIAIAYVKSNSEVRDWEFTRIGALDERIGFELEDRELVIVCGFYSKDSWYLFTTRRIVSKHLGDLKMLDPTKEFEADFENFKGYGEKKNAHEVKREIATLREVGSGKTLRFEYETWNEALPPIYAARYWSVKHPVLDKLMTTAERKEFLVKRDKDRAKSGFKRFDIYGFKADDLDAARQAFESSTGLHLRPLEDADGIFENRFVGRRDFARFTLCKNGGEMDLEYPILLEIGGNNRRREELAQIVSSAGFKLLN